MCLGIPAKVVELNPTQKGKVDYLGTKVETSFALLPDIQVGDWVIVHAGYAITQMNEQEAQETLQLLREYAEAEKKEDQKQS
ncbi:HypC/HybG/HupF family hydrogenase formation chaperone [bacterium]|nr:HypC/HybG/HupF family hydrogenase formation chaperone [bacterium]